MPNTPEWIRMMDYLNTADDCCDLKQQAHQRGKTSFVFFYVA
jgi:hypothetical protein